MLDRPVPLLRVLLLLAALVLANAAAIPKSELRRKFPANYDGSTMHIVFSVSCDQSHRLLLATVLQDTAMRVGQKGPITQIVAGCSEEEEKKILAEPTFYYDYRVHFTPSYSPHPLPEIDDDYSPYNKPFSLRHFLRNANPPVQHETIALVDGDIALFKPLEVNTGRNITKYYKGSRDPVTVTDEVRDGVAMAQDWTAYMGAGWFGDGSAEVICADKPCANVSSDEAHEFYAGTGPPYIMTRHDAMAFIDDYCDFVVEGRKFLSNDWMTEMYAYAAAAANHGIKYTILTNLGVTHPTMGDGTEYWTFLDDKESYKYTANPCEDPFEVSLPNDPPVGVHYCQHYLLNEEGRYFYKYALPLSVVDCDAEVLAVPQASEYDLIGVVYAAAGAEERSKKRHEVWAECSLTKSVNRALLRLKQATCPAMSFNSFQGLELVR